MLVPLAVCATPFRDMVNISWKVLGVPSFKPGTAVLEALMLMLPLSNDSPKKSRGRMGRMKLLIS